MYIIEDNPLRGASHLYIPNCFGPLLGSACHIYFRNAILTPQFRMSQKDINHAYLA